MERLHFPITQAEAKKKGIFFSSDKNRNAVFPSRLRELRNQKGVSQQALADELKVSKSTIGLWENGDTLPDTHSLYELSLYYNVSVDFLVNPSITCNSTTDKDIYSVSEFTGLSNEVVSMLHGFTVNCNSNNDSLSALGKSYLDIINILLESENEEPLLYTIYNYLFKDFYAYGISGDIKNANGSKIALLSKDSGGNIKPEYAFTLGAAKDLLMLQIIGMLNRIRDRNTERRDQNGVYTGENK